MPETSGTKHHVDASMLQDVEPDTIYWQMPHDDTHVPI